MPGDMRSSKVAVYRAEYVRKRVVRDWVIIEQVSIGDETTEYVALPNTSAIALCSQEQPTGELSYSAS